MQDFIDIRPTDRPEFIIRREKVLELDLGDENAPSRIILKGERAGNKPAGDIVIHIADAEYQRLRQLLMACPCGQPEPAAPAEKPDRLKLIP